MLINFIIFILSLIVLFYSSKIFIDLIISIAVRYGISVFLLSIFVVGFGTSLPEIFTSISSSILLKKNIAIGNLIGSNIANTLLVLGACALVYPFSISYKSIYREYILIFILSVLVAFILLDNLVSFLDAICLFALFLFSMFFLYKSSSVVSFDLDSEIETIDVSKNIYSSSFLVLLCLFLMPASSHYIILSSVEIASYLGVSDFFIGATVVALGTSIPELATSFISAQKKQYTLVFGNIIGSNIFNISLALSLVGFIRPGQHDDYVTSMVFREACFLVIITFVFIFFCINKKQKLIMSRLSGLMCLFVYFIYHMYNFIN